MLYEMLSGRRAFRPESAVESMNAILREEPAPLSGADPGISPEKIQNLPVVALIQQDH